MESLKKNMSWLVVAAMMAGGYYFNIKFIQLGIPSLGEERLGLKSSEMGRVMGLLAIITSIVALSKSIESNTLSCPNSL